ncbi:ATP-binding protein [Croceicoccus mobilis]|uniref:histidine kinase n=1 Tax=Croceicoccus mobilis TaxID=1703339 RepID=A0A916Z7E1_9SPHN|nr:histidine kinase dimerization/phospho-acceptor domain-containing protein [Croceicoccus mobilis]GGD79761.1 hypothetical protein GCM10010990_32130 [Croceicoccus mobilis]
MTLDDRLRTVLAVSVDGERAALAQFRQLVDLLGSGGAVADGQLIASAFLRISVLSRRLPVAERVAILGEPGVRLRAATLVAQLCEGDERVAEAALNAADLDSHGWDAIVPMLANGLRRRAELLRLNARRPGVAEADEPADLSEYEPAPPPAVTRGQEFAHDGGDELAEEILTADDMPTPAPAPAPEPSHVSAEGGTLPAARAPAVRTHAFGWRAAPRGDTRPGDIAGLVQRIEEYREHRATRGPEDKPAEPVREIEPTVTAAIIDLRIDSDMRISWAGHFAPMLKGLGLSPAEDASALIDERSAAKLRRQQVVRGGAVTITASPAISGGWRLDAVPRFDTVGRFLGHHARITRQPAKRDESDPRGDEVRQALHELRTPLGALQGFAEIIQQQLFGPVPNRYRAQAADIAAESARLLAGLEEVERLVRMRGGKMAMPGGETALADLLGQLADQFAAIDQGSGAHFVLSAPGADVAIPVAEVEAEGMFWRLLATLSAAAQPGETLYMDLTANGQVELAVTLPASLRGTALFNAEVGRSERGDPVLGMLGAGFALRLVAAEARAAGGALSHDDEQVVIRLPRTQDESPDLHETAA